MEWTSTTDKLPEEGKYVLARHNRGTWHDSTDQENVNCVVVKLVKGISMVRRQFMAASHNPTLKEMAKTYRACDEFSNNKVAYNWVTFGPASFFGQEITHWTPISEVEL